MACNRTPKKITSNTRHLRSQYLDRTSKAKNLHVEEQEKVCVLEGGKGSAGFALLNPSLPNDPSYRCPASRIRHATAVMSAAPLPLPSSDWRKVTSHFGVSCFTVSCMMEEK